MLGSYRRVQVQESLVANQKRFVNSASVNLFSNFLKVYEFTSKSVFDFIFLTGIAINTNQMYLCYLFPNIIGFQMGFNYALKGFGSMFPQFWLMLIKKGTISYQSILWFWAILTFISLVAGLFVLPWKVSANFEDTMPNLFKVWVWSNFSKSSSMSLKKIRY